MMRRRNSSGGESIVGDFGAVPMSGGAQIEAGRLPGRINSSQEAVDVVITG